MNWLNELLHNDPDPAESREWIESIKAVIDRDGPQRAHQLLEGMVELTRRAGAHLPFAPTTEYILPAHGYDFTSTPLWAGIYMLPLTLGMLIAGGAPAAPPALDS